MSKSLIRGALLALLAILFVWPAMASELPTSENPAVGDWTRMRPTSFAPTIKSAREQCDRTAAENATDRLTPAHCERLEQQLEAKQCREVPAVRDGIVFDAMNGRENGRSHITHNIRKKLGRDDPALLCDLGDRVYVYWFVGDPGKSCHNVGVVFAPPLPVSGACGSSARAYSHAETAWPAEGKFCTSGTPSPISIIFPEAGKATFWTCEGSGGGKPDLCQASREATPKKVVEAPPAEVCTLVEWNEQIPPPPTYVNVPPLTVSVCGHYIMSAGGVWQSYSSSMSMNSSVTVRRVCFPKPN